ncbi:MAG: SRPBCC domain-containing protein [Blastocatellia bacterium]|nr:MAG: SRPBCC domain-containing protein [Blastocatellia bacterium]
MADLDYLFPIKSSSSKVFNAIATPEGLNSWWTKTCSGSPIEGNEYELGFGSGYQWRARVARATPPSDFELLITEADADWQGSRLVFRLSDSNGVTNVQFQHLGWPTENEHFRISCYCWAMYLRLLRRYVEFGERVAYEDRLDV